MGNSYFIRKGVKNEMSGFHTLMYHELLKKEDYNRSNYLGISVKQGYHDVLPEALFAFQEEFESQMKYLYENEYVTLNAKQVMDYYYNDVSLPEKAVLLTFDDLYQSIFLNAYPILKKYHFHAIGFIVLDWLFDEPQKLSHTHSVCLSKREIEEMSDVFEFANHTKALHTRGEQLTALQSVDKDLFLKDLKECEEFVTAKKVFAYPYGIYTEENMMWLKEFGTMLAFTSKPGRNNKETNPFTLHRDAVMLHYQLDDFKKLLLA